MRWHVENFKGIKHASIDLTPGVNTVITGVNSSGKSSVTQSLLMAAQSLHGQGPLILNGPMVRLGTAEDLVREASSGEKVVLGIDASPQIYTGPRKDQLQIRYELLPTDDKASLTTTSLKVAVPGEADKALLFSSALSRREDSRNALDSANLQRSGYALHLKSLLGNPVRLVRTYLVMHGLRPVSFFQALREGDAQKLYTKLMLAALAELKKSDFDEGWGPHEQIRFGGYIREFLQLLRKESNTFGQDLKEAYKGLTEARTGNPYRFVQQWRKIDPQVADQLIEIGARRRAVEPHITISLIDYPISRYGYPGKGLLEYDLEKKLGRSLEVVSALNQELDGLAERVHYLGPLRDEPRVVWNHWNEIAKGLPVGTRGEYSAAVLSRKGRRTVDFSDPDGTPSHADLSDAVDIWLDHLEIGESVSARSEGKLGVGIELKVDGKKRDLTQVGVGVSQALPLVVGLLSAPGGSIFIVEQPELHLHPAVQARLADFLLSARPDVSLIIETHSESFITRIRRQVAEEDLDRDMVHIVFVEPQGDGSVGRRLTITEFGDLSEWPKGFLSSAEDDIRAILKANIARAARNSNVD